MDDKKIVTDPDWAKEIEDIKPLKKGSKQRVRLDVSEVEDFDDLEPYEAKPIFMQERQQVKPAYTVDIPPLTESFNRHQHDANVFSAARPSVSSSIFAKLKKGEFPYTSQIDLHGYKEDEAWRALNDFLLQSYMESKHCVLLVHGKGKGYGEQKNMGIIKAHICGWLENSPAVLAYHTALPKHGGSGAVYVLMRRNKKQNIEESMFDE